MSAPHVRGMAERRSPTESLYLLLDPLVQCGADHPLQPASLQQVLGDTAVARVPRQDLAHDRAACPILARMAGPGEVPADALVEASTACATADPGHAKRHVCGWLTSALDLDAMTTHLASICAFDDGAAPEFFPVFEPIRLELLAVADMALTKRRLGPVREWLLPSSSGGNPVLLHGDDAATDAPAKSIALDVLREAPLVTAVLSAWRDALRTDLQGALWAWRGDTPLPPNAAAEAFRQIRHARDLGLSDSNDIVVLALHRLMLHPRLHEHPPIAERIGRAARGERPLSDFFTPITDAQWTHIVHALMDSRTSTP